MGGFILITTLRYGNTNTFLIRGTKRFILIDTDFAGTLPAFYKALGKTGIKVSDIAYVICTHYHPDHCGLVSQLAEQGITPVVMESQTEHVHYPDEIFSRQPQLNYKPILVEGTKTITFKDSRAFLGELGIEGEIIPTPSHSEDSISVILDDGTVIAGDLEPLEYLAGYADNAALKADWDRIMSLGPNKILYAHANVKEFTQS